MFVGQIVDFRLPCGWVEAAVQWFDAENVELFIPGVGTKIVNRCAIMEKIAA